MRSEAATRVIASVTIVWMTTMVGVIWGATTPTARSRAYAEGAPPGFSGGFGEGSCHACHFHAEPNSGPGRLTVSGVPERYVAGESYTITVTLTRPGLKLAGFQLTARAKDGGAQAGTLAPAPTENNRVGVDVQRDIQYLNQRREGSAPVGADTARWSLVWTAPQTSGLVTFHVAANAADGDGTAEGDYVHTAVVETRLVEMARSWCSCSVAASTGPQLLGVPSALCASTATTASCWSPDRRHPAERNGWRLAPSPA